MRTYPVKSVGHVIIGLVVVVVAILLVALPLIAVVLGVLELLKRYHVVFGSVGPFHAYLIGLCISPVIVAQLAACWFIRDQPR